MSSMPLGDGSSSRYSPGLLAHTTALSCVQHQLNFTGLDLAYCVPPTEQALGKNSQVVSVKML